MSPAIDARSKRPADDPVPGADLQLLLLEDDPGDARLLREQLRDMPGVRSPSVEWHQTLGDAVVSISREPPDLILADLELPDSKGLDTVEGVLAATNDAPVIVLTGTDDMELASAALEAGAEDYLLKGTTTPPLLDRALRYAIDRKRGRRERQRQEAFLHQITDNISDVLAVLDGEGRIAYVSPSVGPTLGAPPQEFLGRKATNLVHPDDRTGVEELQHRILAGELNDSVRAQFRALHGDGHVVHMETLGRRLPEEVPIGRILLVARDVTKRKEYEALLERRTLELTERVKEQSCLYDISTILGKTEVPLRERLQGVVERLPGGWHHREIACARLELKGQSWESPDWEETEWRLRTEVELDGEPAGALEVGYLEERPAEDVGPFLNDEVTLLDEIARRIAETVSRTRSLKALRLSEQRYRKLFEDANDAIALTTEDGHFIDVNPVWLDLFGYRPEELDGLRVSDTYADPGERRKHLTALNDGADGEGRVRDAELKLRTKSGRVLDCLVSTTATSEEDGSLRYKSFIRDISPRKQAERELRHQALHDTLTGLPNRALLRDRIQQAIERSRRDRTLMAVFFLDLDRFKVVNDSLGHSRGDRVLVNIARHLPQAVRSNDTVGRLGGDEFVIVAEGLNAHKDIDAAAERIERALSPQELTRICGFELSASIGVAILDPTDGEEADAEDLMQMADIAMYQAKERRGTTSHTFDHSTDASELSRFHRERELKEAIEERRFFPVYQPVISLTDSSPWAIEVLARWADPDRGVVRPSEFIPLAEETGDIVAIGDQIVQAAVEQFGVWRERGLPLDVRLLVNVSSREFEDPELVDRLGALLAETTVPAGNICLELTESAVMKNPDQIKAVKELGMRILVDDFGTGYSSLAYLANLHVDGLKVDRSFVSGLSRRVTDRAIVNTIRQLGDDLSMHVVAEGVETATELRALRKLGIELMQGYAFGRPKKADEVQVRAIDLSRLDINGDVDDLNPPPSQSEVDESSPTATDRSPILPAPDPATPHGRRALKTVLDSCASHTATGERLTVGGWREDGNYFPVTCRRPDDNWVELARISVTWLQDREWDRIEETLRSCCEDCRFAEIQCTITEPSDFDGRH